MNAMNDMEKQSYLEQLIYQSLERNVVQRIELLYLRRRLEALEQAVNELRTKRPEPSSGSKPSSESVGEKE